MRENDQQQQQVHHVANEETNRLYNLQQDQEIVDLDEKRNFLQYTEERNNFYFKFYFVYEIFHQQVKNIEQHVNFVEDRKSVV